MRRCAHRRRGAAGRRVSSRRHAGCVEVQVAACVRTVAARPCRTLCTAAVKDDRDGNLKVDFDSNFRGLCTSWVQVTSMFRPGRSGCRQVTQVRGLRFRRSLHGTPKQSYEQHAHCTVCTLIEQREIKTPAAPKQLSKIRGSPAGRGQNPCGVSLRYRDY
jgi:hypothetical protein